MPIDGGFVLPEYIMVAEGPGISSNTIKKDENFLEKKLFPGIM
jgi:hypothetical protein